MDEVRFCKICGEQLTGRRKDYCGSRECTLERYRINGRKKRARDRGVVRDTLYPAPKPKRDSLEQKVLEAKEKGMTYADIQRMRYGYPPKRRED